MENMKIEFKVNAVQFFRQQSSEDPYNDCQVFISRCLGMSTQKCVLLYPDPCSCSFESCEEKEPLLTPDTGIAPKRLLCEQR